MEELPGVDFCICTRNRLPYVRQCLEALLPQHISGKTNITVVDNQSSDGTLPFLREQSTVHSFLRIEHEPKVGLSHARNKGWQTSTAEWIFYLDDDCVVPEGFVEKALSIVQSANAFAVIGGPAEPVYEKTRPPWFPEGYGGFSLPLDSLKEVRNGSVRGMCFLIRREVLAIYHGFRTDLGVKKNQLRYGEEIELQWRLRHDGHKIGYTPALKVYHHMRAEKIRLTWILHSEMARRRDKMAFDSVSFPLATWHLTRTIGGRLIWMPVHFSRCLFDRTYPWKRALYDSLRPLAYRWGEWIGAIKFTFKNPG